MKVVCGIRGSRSERKGEVADSPPHRPPGTAECRRGHVHTAEDQLLEEPGCSPGRIDRLDDKGQASELLRGVASATRPPRIPPPRAPQKLKSSEKRPRQNYDPCPAVSELMRGHESNMGRWNERRESGWPRLPAQGDDSASTMQISWGKCFSRSLRRTVLLPLTRAMRKEGVRASSSRNVFDLDTM